MARTTTHIALVGANLRAMDGFQGLRRTDLERRARRHDASKFTPRERDGYAWLTWRYDEQARGAASGYPAAAEAVVARAMARHRAAGRHHPEAHPSPDAMGLLDVVEMVCDWTAIAQETRGPRASCLAWARGNVHRRWRFSPPKRDLIFAVIRELDRRNSEV